MIMRYLTLSLSIFLLAACGGGADSGPEAELRDWVARGELAVEEKDRGDLLDLIAESYADSRGNDRDSLGDILRVYFFRQESIALLTSIDEIKFYDDSAAQVIMTVGMAGTNSGALGFSADTYRFELELQKLADEWTLIGARWGELGGELR
jgi:hypothetical protein